MKVFIILRSIDYEDMDVNSVHSCEATADAKAEELNSDKKRSPLVKFIVDEWEVQ